MYRVLSASKDTYITNKVVNNQRVTDANVGNGGTLDLFRLYGESTLTSESGTIDEISRLLIKFDLDPLRQLTGSILDITDSSFKATLKLKDVFGGQTVPSNFTIAVFPLSKSFDEGQGRDIIEFRDLDVANFLTASISGETPVTWSVSGADDSTNDYIGTQGVYQTFTLGTEDLSVDISNIVSSTLKGDLPDHGFRISFSGTHETDTKTRFVKRFASRHAGNPLLRPQIAVKWDDSLQDDHKSMFFDHTGSLFLHNFFGESPANLMSGSSVITGSNCLILKIISGSSTNTVISGTVITGTLTGTQYLSQTIVSAPSTFAEKILTASQYSIGGNFVTGVYFATFAVAHNESSALFTEIKNANSATFTEIWESFDGTLGYFTGSLVVKTVNRTAFSTKTSNSIVRVINNDGEYQRTEKVRFRVWAQSNDDSRAQFSKLPVVRPSAVFKNMLYQIRDVNSKRIVIPFDSSSTKMSVDSDGMYFDLYMDSLAPGLVYGIEIQYTEKGITETMDFNETGAVFRVNV